MRWMIPITLICLGCGAAAPAPGDADRDRLDPRNLYPLAEGNAWSYDVDLGDGERVLAITRVVSAGSDRAEILTNNKETLQYELRPGGIYRPENASWLLKAPVREGAEWPTASGMMARVRSVSAGVTTPGGDFADCVEVEEGGGDAGRQIRTIYCPGVGPVYLESMMLVRGKEIRVTARLRGHRVGAE
jgi:hypothetical protein